MAEFVAMRLRKASDSEVERFEVRPGRPNVLARLRSGVKDPPLVLLAHTDTVPKGEGWTRDPFGGEIVEGRLYGRGACDMKSGLAVAMAAFEQAARRKVPLRRDLLLCATMDEEGKEMLGAIDLLERGVVGKDTLIICTEPSNLEVVVAHKGVMWYEVEATGRNAHAGNPHVGVDAIRAAAAFIQGFYGAVTSLPHEHERLGRAAVTFGRINGGFKTNVVPDRARVEIDVRMVPPMDIPRLEKMVNSAASEAAAEVHGAKMNVNQLTIDRPPVEADPNGPVVEALCAAAGRHAGTAPTLSGFPAYTDAAIIAARTGNQQCIVFGPGRLTEAHTLDEYVSTEQVERAELILTEAVMNLCGSP